MIQTQQWHDHVVRARAFFRTGQTTSVTFRRDILAKMEKYITQEQAEIEKALFQDLGKTPYESYMSEIGLVLAELRVMRKHIKQWTKPKKLRTSWTQFPSRAVQYHDPYGVVLIMSPWNYPFQLSMMPLIGSIASGNASILKPSAYSPSVSKWLVKMCREIFPDDYVQVVLGGREEIQALLSESFDYIFFTGSPPVGKIVMESATKHLTPVTLELGGKSPCIVDDSVNLEASARRIMFGKLMNNGQTCVAPDYILVHESVKIPLIEALKNQHRQMVPDQHYEKKIPHIINAKHMNRIKTLLQEEQKQIIYGGHIEEGACRVSFTLLEMGEITAQDVWQRRVMKEELFAPILPIITYKTWDELYEGLIDKPKPLALYLFSNDRIMQQRITKTLSFGGGCINDTLVHLSSPHQPFGGVGNSGMGAYHGKKSIETFTHQKTVIKKSWWGDVSLRYHPYKDSDSKPPSIFFK